MQLPDAFPPLLDRQLIRRADDGIGILRARP
jgi:hypothetical protein